MEYHWVSSKIETNFRYSAFGGGLAELGANTEMNIRIQLKRSCVRFAAVVHRIICK